jgi:hypothetical protein
MTDELPLDDDPRVFTYISPGGWATRRLSEVRPEPPAPNFLVAWHVGEPKAPAYEGQRFRVVDSRRLSADTIHDAMWYASRVWWARLHERLRLGLHQAMLAQRAALDAFGLKPKDLGLGRDLPAPLPAAEPDLLALAAEADGLARRLHDIYNTLRPAHPYSWSLAMQARDTLEELAKQLRDDALDFHPDVQGSDN